jgi:hypothetical protein
VTEECGNVRAEKKRVIMVDEKKPNRKRRISTLEEAKGMIN